MLCTNHAAPRLTAYHLFQINMGPGRRFAVYASAAQRAAFDALPVLKMGEQPADDAGVPMLTLELAPGEEPVSGLLR